MQEYAGLRDQIALMGLAKPDAYNPYAAGAKVYGTAGLNNPNGGTVSKEGYRERDRAVQARKNALLSRMQAANAGEYLSSDWLKGSALNGG